jgi:hypothetical protein
MLTVVATKITSVLVLICVLFLLIMFSQIGMGFYIEGNLFYIGFWFSENSEEAPTPPFTE